MRKVANKRFQLTALVLRVRAAVELRGHGHREYQHNLGVDK